MPNPFLVDIHAHVNFHAFREDGESVLQRALDRNIWTINVGSQKHTSASAIQLAEKFDKGIFACVGLHPIHLEQQFVDEEDTHFKTRAERFDPDIYLPLAKHEKTVAIGECGLDYYRLPSYCHPELAEGSSANAGSANSENTSTLSPSYLKRGLGGVTGIKERQHNALIQQIELANGVGKPVMFHTRASREDPEDAYIDLIKVIKNHPPMKGGDIHCFSGSKDIAKQFLDLGLHLSFTGIITFKNAEDLRQVVRYVPLERIMVETDSPYLAPEPYRGKQNEPAYVEFVAKKVAEVKGVSIANVAEQTTANAINLFQLM